MNRLDPVQPGLDERHHDAVAQPVARVREHADTASIVQEGEGLFGRKQWLGHRRRPAVPDVPVECLGYRGDSARLDERLSDVWACDDVALRSSLDGR